MPSPDELAAKMRGRPRARAQATQPVFQNPAPLHNTPVQVMLTSDHAKALKLRAVEEGTTISDILRKLVAGYLNTPIP